MGAASYSPLWPGEAMRSTKSGTFPPDRFAFQYAIISANDAADRPKKAPGNATLYRTRARRCVTTAPIKKRTKPIAAAIPKARTPSSPTTSPVAPASFTAANAGNQEHGTPTLAEFASTNPAGMRSATAIAAVTIAVFMGQSVAVQLFPQRRAV